MAESNKRLKAFGANVASFDSILNADGILFREHKNRRTLYIKRNGRGYFLKIHRRAGWKEILKNVLSLRWPVLSAQNELCAIRRLEELGIDTVKAAGYGKRGLPPAWLESYIITEELQNTISLEDFCKDWKLRPPATRLKWALIKRVATIARRLHMHGVNHRDFYLCHFLLDINSLEKEADEGPRLYLIDLHRVQLRKRTPQRWIIKDLAGLYFSCLDINLTRNDVFRFMKTYTGKSLRSVLKEDGSFWEKVQVRAKKLYDKHLKNQGRGD